MTLAWPNSPVAVALKKVRKMVALSASLQSRAAIDYTAALNRVFIEYIPDQEELIRDTGNEFVAPPVSPWAAIWPMETSNESVEGGIQLFTIPAGMMHLYVACEPLPTITDWNESRLEAVGFLDQWIQDVLALSGAEDATSDDGMGHLTIVAAPVHVIDHTAFKTRESTGNFYYMSCGLKYTAGGGF